MKHISRLILAVLLATLPAFAQDNISQSTGIIGNGRLLGAKTYDGQTTVGVLGIDSDGNTTVKSLSGKDVLFSSNLKLSNDTYLQSRNAAGSADIDVLKVNGTDDTFLNADTGDIVNIGVAGTSIVNVTSGGFLPTADGNNSTSNLGTGSFGWKNIHLSDATNRASLYISNGFYNSYPTGQSMFFREASTDRWSIRATSGDFAASASGNTIALQEATAGSKCMGSATANGTTAVTVSTTCATTGSRIFLSRSSAPSGTAICWWDTLSNGVSFNLDCNGAETGTFDWMIIHEAP